MSSSDRMHKKLGLIRLYIFNLWLVKYLLYKLKNNRKNAADKIHFSYDYNEIIGYEIKLSKCRTE